MSGSTSSTLQAVLPAHEEDRLESLLSYGVLDTAPEPVYDDLVRMAAELCGASVAAVSLVDVDRLWFKARVGIPMEETPRIGSMCNEVVTSRAPLVVMDSHAEPQWEEAARWGVRAYAGVPLIGRDGLPIGALCVVDTEPRTFSPETIDWLEMLARQAMTHLELQRTDQRAGLVPGFDTDDLLRPERIRAALDDGELVPYLQPIIDLRTGSVCGGEALLRWEHPEHGVVPPGSFIPMLEATGLILPVGRQVLRDALASVRRLRADGVVADDFGVSVNISALQAAQQGFARGVLEELAAQELSPKILTVELTETASPTSDDVVRQELEALRAAGVKVDADDLGSGHSTLQRVLDLPVTAVKLDLSIISRVTHEPRIATVVGWLVRAAHELGLDVVAEGVETLAQLEFLRSVGCDRAQGYLFGKAVPPALFVCDGAR